MIAEVLILLIPIAITLVMSFFFSGSETAVISANLYQLRHRHEQGDAQAGKTLDMLSSPSRMMTAVLVGNSLVNVLTVLFFKLLLDRTLPISHEPAFAFVHWDEVLIVAGLTPVILIFAEILPKALFRARADEWIVAVRLPLVFFRTIFLPAILLLEGIVRVFLIPFGGRAGMQSRRMTRGDLILMLNNDPWAREEEPEGDEGPEPSAPSVENSASRQDQTAWIREPDERRLIQNIIELSATQAREIMQPLVDLEAVPLGQTTIEGFIQLAARSGHSRYPAFRHRIVRLVGYIDLYEVIRDTSGRTNLEDFLRPGYFVPETKRVDDLLKEFLENRLHSAIVVDEYGGCSGWVTLEDIIEEIVGELEDELDEPVIPITEQADGSYVIEGRCAIEDVNEVMRTSFKMVDYDTFGGLMMQEMGRIPKVGDEISLQGWRMRVTEMDGMRVALVQAFPQNAA